MEYLNLEHMFQLEFFKEEIDKYRFKIQKRGNCEILYADIPKICRAYCYMDFLNEILKVPVLKIDGQIIMSLSPMEIQSHIIPIHFATGRVGVAGLGLGYYVQSILKKEEVTEVIVYEINQAVIDLYLENFGTDPKLKILLLDCLTIKNETFDFFYNDIYPDMLNRNVFAHRQLLTAQNNIKKYHFWTEEEVILELLYDRKQDGFSYFDEELLNAYIKFCLLLIEKKQGVLSLLQKGKEFYKELKKYY